MLLKRPSHRPQGFASNCRLRAGGSTDAQRIEDVASRTAIDRAVLVTVIT
jgi:hypothetical protein